MSRPRKLVALSLVVLVVSWGSVGVADISGEAEDVEMRQSVRAEVGPEGDVDETRVFTQLTIAGDGEVEVVQPDPPTRGVRNLESWTRPERIEGGLRWRGDIDETEHHRYVADFDRELPVDVSVRYWLDGDEIEPGDLVGESGRLTIRYTLTNDTLRETELTHRDGLGEQRTTEVDLALPLVATFSSTLDDRFAGVEAGGAVVAGDGRGNTVVNWSAVLFEPLGSPEQTLEIRGHVVDAVTPRANINVAPVTTRNFGSLEGAQEAYGDAAAATNELTTGAGIIDKNLLRLADGAGELLDGLTQLAEGSIELNTGLMQARDGAQQLAAGLDQAETGGGDLAVGLAQLEGGARQLSEGLGQADAGGSQLADGAGELAAGAGRAFDGGDQLAGGARQLADGAGALAGGAQEVATGAAALSGGAAQLTAGLVAARSGAQQILDGLEQVEGGLQELGLGLPVALAGVEQLRDGVEEILAGLGEPTDVTDQTIFGGINLVHGGLDQLRTQLATGEATLANARNILDGVMQQSIGSNLLVWANTAYAMFGCDPETDPAGSACDLLNAVINDGDHGLFRLVDTDPNDPGPLPLARALVEGVRAGLAGAIVIDDDDPGGIQRLQQGLAGIRGGLVLVADGLSTGDPDDPGVYEGLIGLTMGLEAAIEGVAELTAGATQLVAGQSDLVDGLDQLLAGAQQLSAGSQQLAAGTGELAAGAGQVAGGAVQVADGAEELSGGLGELFIGSQRLGAGAAELSDGLGQLFAGSVQLLEGAGTAADGAQQLSGGLTQLSDGADRLASGLGDAEDGSGRIADGLGQARDGGEQIADGSARLQEEGTSQLLEGVNDATASSSLLVAQVRALDERGEEEGLPYGAPDGAAASAVYQYVLASEDGRGGANLGRILGGAAVLGLAAGAEILRRRLVGA